MDQSQMLSIIGGFYDKLVSDVADRVTAQITSAGAAQIALDSEEFKSAVRNLFADDTLMRESVRDLVTDALDNYDLTDNSEFTSLTSKVDELEEASSPIDADNDDFADAVREVIRNCL